MRKILSLLFSLAIVFNTISPVYAAFTVAEADPSAIVDDALQAQMDFLQPEDLICVTIELCDTIELDSIAQQAAQSRNVQKALEKHAEISLYSNVEYLPTEEQIAIQREVYDVYQAERIGLIASHYQEENGDFLYSAGLENCQYESVGLYSPFIRNIFLTSSQIEELVQNPDVCRIDLADTSTSQDDASVSDTVAIIRGNQAVNADYKGTGIRVGMIEEGNPNTSLMGTDGNNIYVKNPNNAATINSNHATMVAGIIKKMAPNCIIYSRATSANGDTPSHIEALISGTNPHVINISYGKNSSLGIYNTVSRDVDAIVRNTNIPIITTSGNTGPGKTQYINEVGLAPNAITVGNVTSSGTIPASNGAFVIDKTSIYIEGSNANVVNKPDVCAPGDVAIYSLSGNGTSFAAPHVTGAVVQMLSRNSNLIGKPTMIKAILMASAKYTAGTPRPYMGTYVSDKEGAGVIDASLCYNTAASLSTKTKEFTANTSTTSLSYTMNVASTSSDLRLAITWESISSGSSTTVANYDVTVKKGSATVATSSGVNGKTNYEIISIPSATLKQYGTGTYTVTITRATTVSLSSPIDVALAWIVG